MKAIQNFKKQFKILNYCYLRDKINERLKIYKNLFSSKEVLIFIILFLPFIFIKIITQDIFKGSIELVLLIFIALLLLIKERKITNKSLQIIAKIMLMLIIYNGLYNIYLVLGEKLI